MSHLLAKAAESGNLPALLRLLDGGADIEWTHKGTGRTALLSAVIAEQREAAVALLDRGARIDHQCKAMGYSALAWAGHGGDVQLAALLIERGAALDLASPELKRTALMSAAQAGHGELVGLLLEAGADPHLLDFNQQNAWALAQDNGHQEVLQRLEQSGVGAPAAPEQSPPLPWPSNTDDLTAPCNVVRGYTLAMHAWEQRGNARSTTDPEPSVDEGFWAEQEQLVARFCTQRERAYKHHAYGWPTTYAPEDQLLSCETLSTHQAAVIIRDPAQRSLCYEHRFLLKRVAGQWRIDSAKRRLAGTEEWQSSIL